MPALLVGTAVDGLTAWVHAHGPFFAHVHLVSAGLGQESSAADERHAREHEHDEHEHEHHSHRGTAPEPVPLGLQVELPGFQAMPPRESPLTIALHLPALALVDQAWTVPDPRFATHGPTRTSGVPRSTGQRSGVAALLSSNHAIRI